MLWLAVGVIISVLGLAGMVLISVSVALVIWPTKEDPEVPGEKHRDWPVIVGCLIGGILAFKLSWALVNLVSPIGRVGRISSMGRRMGNLSSVFAQYPMGRQAYPRHPGFRKR
jgi:hypothetical protein